MIILHLAQTVFINLKILNLRIFMIDMKGGNKIKNIEMFAFLDM